MQTKYKRWTDDEDELLKKLYQEKTLNELAEVFGRSANKVCRRATRLGIKKDKTAIGKEVSKKLKQMFQNGELSNKGNKNPNWKGGTTTICGGIDPKIYRSVHWWLWKTYGKAYKCENAKCEKTNRRFEWAKLKDKEYAKKKENFMMLCKSCHSKYDRLPHTPPSTTE